ncbi:MAG: tetratricopeptide repeat protein [Muribaculaceae bacterium]|nr:tetratricopeptide repeat protein [Muribaculaceae bacterium]
MKTYCKSATYIRRLGLTAAVSASALLLPVESHSQAYGTTGWSDPLDAGYIYRASEMLKTGNPLGTLNQINATSNAQCTMHNAQSMALEGVALFERKDPACVEILLKVAKEYPTTEQATQALLTVGDWYWYQKDWHEALKYYDQVEINHLATEQCNLYSYRKALAGLNCGLTEQSAPLFKMLEKVAEYSTPAKYYSAYILYRQGDYDTAYEMMKEVAETLSDTPQAAATTISGRSGRKTNSSHANLARGGNSYVSDGIEPLYYMTQMEYLKGKYDEVIEHAGTIMAKRPVAELLPELHRVAGLSYFKQGDLASARGHLEEFVGCTEFPNDDAVYALGAAEYADGDYDQAKKHFQTLTDGNDMLAQGAYLYLGQIAEKEGEMNAAAMAFKKAADMAYDAKVAETALYNYIATSSKGGSVPFASSVAMHEDFLKRYPSSQYASKVEESLATAYFREKDYSKALESINRVKRPTSSTLATKQKILYKLGCGEISAGQLKSAASHLREAASMTSTDAALAAESSLWLGDALYQQGEYKTAEAAYNTALKGNLTTANRILARYGLAYSQFQSRQWREAERNFAAVADDRHTPADIKGDALIREGDCFLYLRQFSQAASKYKSAINSGLGDVDYASFRHAVVAGVTDGTDRKMKELDVFLSERPNSKWTPEALLEAGKTMAALDRPDKAAPYFERLSREYPHNNQSRSGALSLALSYMKQGETAKAETAYREIISKWPTSEEASLANDDMRRIAGANGSLEEYARFLASIPGAPQIDPDEMDAISFEAAETAYAENPQATGKLETYVEQYTDGRYLANALMDLAEAADNDGDSDKALSYLGRLLSARGDSPQVPAALYLQAQLLEDAGNSAEALESYLALEKRGGMDFTQEATAGVMRNTADARQRTEYARRLIAMGGVSAEDAEDARFYEASGLLRGSDSDAGVKALEKLAANPDNLAGAKAAVELGEWYLEKGDSKKALAVLEKFTDAGSIHSYWLARGFIALSDAYRAEGNEYLAKEYLKSLRENYPGDEKDIKEGIEKRL